MVELESMVGVVQGMKGRTTDIVYDLFFLINDRSI